MVVSEKMMEELRLLLLEDSHCYNVEPVEAGLAICEFVLVKQLKHLNTSIGHA